MVVSHEIEVHKKSPVAPTLFALCVRQLSLWPKSNISALPQNIAKKIENLREVISVVISTHQAYVNIDSSWICVQEKGDLNWPETCARCCNEMQPDSRFVFETINGLSTQVTWQRLSEEQRNELLRLCDDELLRSGNRVITNTALLMLHGYGLVPMLQYESVVIAAENGWPGAVRAWIGIQDDLLNNVRYGVNDNVVLENLDRALVQLGPEQNAGHAVMIAIRSGHYHMLSYVPVTSVASSFHRLYPDGRVPLSFFRRLTYPPVAACRLNSKLIGQLEYVAQKLLSWMPQLDIRLVKRQANEEKDFKVLDLIEQFQ